MSSQQVTLVGVAYTDKTGNPPIHLTIVAEMYSTGLGVGGGPMPGGPPLAPTHPWVPPLGIWGPTDPRPGTGLPGNQPYPDNSLPGGQPHPDQSLPGPQPVPGWPPIAMPPIFYPPPIPPVGSGDSDGFVKPPPEGGGWAYHESYGWLFSPKGAGPKTSP
jgi:hypothetical protein